MIEQGHRGRIVGTSAALNGAADVSWFTRQSEVSKVRVASGPLGEIRWTPKVEDHECFIVIFIAIL
jgi:hypothetical protein